MFEKLLDQEYLREIINSYWYLGPLIGIGLPFIESLLPVLPLVAIVTLNIYVFGPVLGFTFSYIGNVVGSFIVYSAFRYFFKNTDATKFKKVKFMKEEKLIPLMLIYCFPFTPSSIINATCGFLKFDRDKFIAALVIGKIIMLILLTAVGSTFSDFIVSGDIKSLLITTLIMTGAYLVGKLVEKKFDL